MNPPATQGNCKVPCLRRPDIPRQSSLVGILGSLIIRSGSESKSFSDDSQITCNVAQESDVFCRRNSLKDNAIKTGLSLPVWLSQAEKTGRNARPPELSRLCSSPGRQRRPRCSLRRRTILPKRTYRPTYGGDRTVRSTRVTVSPIRRRSTMTTFRFGGIRSSSSPMWSRSRGRMLSIRASTSPGRGGACNLS